jgi:hypothetical protein
VKFAATPERGNFKADPTLSRITRLAGAPCARPQVV